TVVIEARELGPTGADRIELMLASNKGEDTRPLTKVASGGELSRIMLALKLGLLTSGRIESPGSAGARSNAKRCAESIESPGSAGARSNAKHCAESIESPGSAGARSNAKRCAESIESPGSAGARSNAKRCAESIDDVATYVFDEV